MAALRTPFVKKRHAWTADAQPWMMDLEPAIPGEADAGRRHAARLFHYLSGGGLRAFGGLNERLRVERRQNRFLVIAAVLAVGWLVCHFCSF